MENENNEEKKLFDIIEGYAFVDKDMRILCCDNNTHTMLMLPWSKDLDQSLILVLWFCDVKDLREYVVSNNLYLKIYTIPEDIMKLLDDNDLEAVKIEKDSKTNTVYIV